MLIVMELYHLETFITVVAAAIESVRAVWDC
jgi:hypothetical protein